MNRAASSLVVITFALLCFACEAAFPQAPQVTEVSCTTNVTGPRAMVGIAVLARQPSGKYGPMKVELVRVVMPARTGSQSGWMWTGHGIDTRKGDGVGRLVLFYSPGAVAFRVYVDGMELGGGSLAVPSGLVWDRVRLQCGGQQPALSAMIRQTEIKERVSGTTTIRWRNPAQLQGWELCGPGYSARVDSRGLRPARDGDTLLIRKDFRP